MKKILLTLFLVSCTNSNYSLNKTVNWSNSSYLNETSLLEISSEKINFSSSDTEIFDKIIKLVEAKRPSKVELSCNLADVNCSKIRKILLSYSINVKDSSQNLHNENSDVSLIYERVTERDCYNQFNSTNINNANPPLGCAVTSNVIKMVNDKNQFISPKLLSLQDAKTAVKVVRQIK